MKVPVSTKNKVPSKFANTVERDEFLPFAELERIKNEPSLDRMFNAENSNAGENVKELFAEEKVKARTDLSARQISRIARAYYMCELLQMPEIKQLLNEFITLRISHDRKSRAEFVEGLKAHADNMQNGIMQGLRGAFNK